MRAIIHERRHDFGKASTPFARYRARMARHARAPNDPGLERAVIGFFHAPRRQCLQWHLILWHAFAFQLVVNPLRVLITKDVGRVVREWAVATEWAVAVAQAALVVRAVLDAPTFAVTADWAFRHHPILIRMHVRHASVTAGFVSATNRVRWHVSGLTRQQKQTKSQQRL